MTRARQETMGVPCSRLRAFQNPVNDNGLQGVMESLTTMASLQFTGFLRALQNPVNWQAWLPP
jgi:hypothetical protein